MHHLRAVGLRFPRSARGLRCHAPHQFLAAVFFQMGVVWAKKFHPKRFDQVTLVGLWLVTFLLALS